VFGLNIAMMMHGMQGYSQVKHEEITVYEKMNILKIGMRLYRRNFHHSLFTKAELEELNTGHCEFWLSDTGPCPLFFAMPAGKRTSCFFKEGKVIGLMTQYTPIQNPITFSLSLYTGCLRVVQKAVKNHILKRRLERFELAVGHSKSKLWRLTWANYDVLALIRQHYAGLCCGH